MPLNPKQQRFVDEYLLHGNARQAAVRAGYSAHSAHVNGYRLLENASIKALIQQKQLIVAEKAETSAAEVIRDLARLKNLTLTVPAGEPTDTWHPSTAAKSLELLGKYHQIPGFSNAPAIAVNTGIVVNIHLGDDDEG